MQKLTDAKLHEMTQYVEETRDMNYFDAQDLVYEICQLAGLVEE